MTIRPPNLSVQIPSGRRNNAPVNTGVEVSRPNSAPLRPSSFLIGMPITPDINHTAKQTMNAHVVTASTIKLLTFDMLSRLTCYLAGAFPPLKHDKLVRPNK
jgi:hypothetical protein